MYHIVAQIFIIGLNDIVCDIMIMEIGCVESNAVKSAMSIMYGGVGVACTKFPTANSGENDIEKTIIQKRNENENTVKNDK